jgi:hypothetical protein
MENEKEEKYIYALLHGSEWEDIILFLTEEDAINASIKYPDSRVEIFHKTELGYIASYNFYKNGKHIIRDI